jgi:hypothetical protein
MPPKRGREEKTEPSDSDADDNSSLLATEHDCVVNAFRHLPTESALAQIVGVATRLSNIVANLRYSSARGDIRVFKDSVQILKRAAHSIASAITDLTGLECALQERLAMVTAQLAESVAHRHRR